MTAGRRPGLWLLVAALDDPGTPYAAATLGWLADEAGVSFELYLESVRDGSLFGTTGSTVLGGDHLGRFALLCGRYDVGLLVLGRHEVLASTARALGVPVLASADTVAGLVAAVAAEHRLPAPEALVVGPSGDLAAYLYPEIRYRRALGVPAVQLDTVPEPVLAGPAWHAGLPADARDRVVAACPRAQELSDEADALADTTLAIARRWRSRAGGVAFGDPVAILSQAARLMREERVAAYAPPVALPPERVRVSAYTEECSAIADEVGRLAVELGNRVIVGRQTTDGDLFTWSRRGVAMQITEPGRPVFPVLGRDPEPWTPAEPFDAAEPDDAELHALADAGVVLTTLLWHSGEIAHNEAMLNIADLAGATGLRTGIGVHADRYETAGAQWELIAMARERGGVRGLVEPLLHSGGQGVMAEAACPPALLTEHCCAALERIRAVAGPEHTPHGYYAFCDTDLDSLAPAPAPAQAYRAIEAAGLSYVVSSARPGRNRILYRSARTVVLNQSARSVAQASPFVRVTTLEEIREDAPGSRPGWMVATLDAPVVAFDPYIWRHGGRFMRIVDWMTDGQAAGARRNVLPSTIARYARVLADRGRLPAVECEER